MSVNLSKAFGKSKVAIMSTELAAIGDKGKVIKINVDKNTDPLEYWFPLNFFLYLKLLKKEQLL